MRPSVEVREWSRLGGLIRDRRHDLGITQAEAASRARVSRSWLARVEAGHRGAELEQLMRLLEALDLALSIGPADTTPQEPLAALDARSTRGTPLPDRERQRRARRLAWNLPPSRERTEKR